MELGRFPVAELRLAFEAFEGRVADAARTRDWDAWVGQYTPDVDYVEHAAGTMKGRAEVREWIYRTMAEESFVSTEKAEQQLGFHAQYSNKDALVRMYDWYAANLDEFRGQSGVTHRVPWSQGILKLAKVAFR